MRPRLTYANVVSSICLFLVLTGGAAYALDGSNTVFSDDIVNGEVRVADIGQGQVAADEVAANAVRASEIADGQVGAAEIATAAVRTDEVRNGQVQAEDLAPGVAPGASGARAWGLVNSDGTLLRSKQVTGVTNPVQGIYCIDPAPGIDPTTAVMVVEEDFAGDTTNDALDRVSHTEWYSGAPDCPAGTMEILAFLGDGNPPTFGETDSGGFSLTPWPMRFTFVIP